MSEEWQYVLVMPEHGMVGIGPTDDLRAVEQDEEAWLEETGRQGTIMRRSVGDWEDMPAHPEPDAGDVETLAEELWANSASPGAAPTDTERDLAHAILASDWLANQRSAAREQGRAESDAEWAARTARGEGEAGPSLDARFEAVYRRLDAEADAERRESVRIGMEAGSAGERVIWETMIEALVGEWDSTVYKLPPGYPMTVNEFCRTWFKAPLRALLTADRTKALDAVKAQAAREAGERIAQAIEAGCVHTWTETRRPCESCANSAAIARAGSDTNGGV